MENIILSTNPRTGKLVPIQKCKPKDGIDIDLSQEIRILRQQVQLNTQMLNLYMNQTNKILNDLEGGDNPVNPLVINYSPTATQGFGIQQDYANKNVYYIFIHNLSTNVAIVNFFASLGTGGVAKISFAGGTSYGYDFVSVSFMPFTGKVAQSGLLVDSSGIPCAFKLSMIDLPYASPLFTLFTDGSVPNMTQLIFSQ